MFSISEFPSLDVLELAIEPEFKAARFEKLFPLKSGTAVTGLKTVFATGNRHRFFDEIVSNTGRYSFSYHHKPLLLYFYEKEWGTIAAGHLRQLNEVRNELNRNNVNLLVVTSGSLENFQRLSWETGWLLEIYEDKNNELASLLHLYSKQSPAWITYAGIEGNVALPALYLLDTARRVALDFPNEEISSRLPLEAVVPVLNGDAPYWQGRKSA